MILSMINKLFKNIYAVTILLLLSVSISANDGPFMFDRISKDQGLSSNSISSIQQDSKGFLWIGTQSGLNYYDGYKFKVFNNDPFNENSIAHDLVQSLFIDEGKDIVWIGTYNGVSRLDIATTTFTNYTYDIENENSISSPVVTAMDKDQDGNLWISTLGGLNRLVPETGVMTSYMNDENDSKSLMNDVVRSVIVDSKNRVWVGTLSGIDLYNPETDNFIHYPYIEDQKNGLPSPYVMTIIEKKEDVLFVGTWGGGITKFNVDTESYTNFETQDNRIYTLRFDSNGLLWAGSWGGGLYILETNSGLLEHLKNEELSETGISSNTIYSLFEDNTGIFWIGTNGGGLNKLNYQKQDFNFLSHSTDNDDGLSSGKVETIFEDNLGNIWIGVYNGGLDKYNPEIGKLIHYRYDKNDPTSISNDIFTSIFQDSRDRIWITTNEGINIYQPDTDSFMRLENKFISDKKITPAYTRIIEDEQQNIWLGTYFNGLLKLDLDFNNFKLYDNVSDKLIRAILERSDGDLWIGTNRGLNKLNEDGESFTTYFLNKENPQGMNNDDVRALAEDSSESLWIGTSGGGVMRYNDDTDTFTHYTTKDGLSSNYVMAMKLTQDDHLWISTKNGVSIIDTTTGKIETITKEDGLKTMEFSEGILVDSYNRVYLGSFDSVSSFEGSTTIVNKSNPNIYISSVELDNEIIPGLNPHSNIKEIITTYEDARYITFNFVGLNYLNPQKTRYSYKLEGFDKEWSKKDPRNFALYTNLSPGKYTLKVKAENNDGIESEKIAQLDIIITPPLWRTWWAYMLYTIFILIFIYLLVSLKTNLDRKKRLLELEIINRNNKDLSITDPLTKIFNRRFLKQRFESEIETAVMYGTPLTTIMMDIDDFKNYNDTYGHQLGDTCLVKVVEATQTVLNRPDDSFIRYGGEEFCIILPRTNVEGARIIAEHIRKAVEDTGLITVSIGIHTKIPKASDTSFKLIKNADEALYTAKKNGKNRFVIK